MAKVITEGAQMQCDKGVKPSQIKVTSQDHATIKGRLQATDMELVAEENIPSFGACKITHSKCIPHLMKWTDTTEFSSISGMKELTIKSSCKCSLGGKVTFVQETTNSFIDNLDGREDAGESRPTSTPNEQAGASNRVAVKKELSYGQLIGLGVALLAALGLMIYLMLTYMPGN